MLKVINKPTAEFV